MIVIILRIINIFFLIGLIFACRRSIKKRAKASMYSYRIVSLVGLLFFICECLLLEIVRFAFQLESINEVGVEPLMEIVTNITSVFTSLVYLAFIPVIVFSVFLLISNIILLIKEGRTIHNTLGVALGAILVVGSLAVINCYAMLSQVMNVFSYLGYHISVAAENLFAIVVIYLECMMLATIYTTIMSVRHKASFDKTHIIVLGCHVQEDGMPSGVLRKRVESAVKFANAQNHKTNTMPILVFSGGKGADEPVSEAEAMRRYTAVQKYPGKVLLEDQSTTTYENFKYSKKLIGKTKNIAFATTDFHVFRSGVFATNLGFKQIEGIGAKSPWYFYNNALIREFVANLNAERKMHLVNILVIYGLILAMVIVSYCFNIM